MLCELLLVGDSLIAGFQYTPYMKNAINEAVVGAHSYNIKDQIYKGLERCNTFKSVFVHIGTNDILGDHKGVIRDIKEISNLTSAFVYVSQIMPTCRRDLILKRDDLDMLLEQELLKESSMVYAPLPADMVLHLTKDCVHLKRSGYDLWYTYIQQYLKLK